MTMPIAQVIRPPVRKLMRRGERFEKSLAGETTLAATLTLSVAISKAIMARTTAKGLPRRARTATGFQSASPKMIRGAGEDSNWVPERFAKNDQSGGSDGDADEGIESHGGGEAEGLANDLVALAA